MTGADIAMAIAAIGVAALVALGVVSWRFVRRIRTLRARIRRAVPATLEIIPGPVAAATAWAHFRRGWFSARLISSTGSKRQALVLRRELWQHVDRANAALSHAQAADAPLGELPRLVRQLGDLARQQDRELAFLTPNVAADNLEAARAETQRITDSADEITDAAMEALRSTPNLNSHHVASVIGQEVQAVRAGFAQLRSTSRGR